MSESEMVDLFGVFIPKLRNTIKSLYKEELIKPYEAERTIKKRDNLYVTVYNMEVVLLLAFRLNSYQARAVCRELIERISRGHKQWYFKLIKRRFLQRMVRWNALTLERTNVLTIQRTI